MDTNLTVIVTDELQDKVVDVLAVLTGNDGVFTAYDVTKQLRLDNPTIEIMHDEVKEMVREHWVNMFCDEYESTLTRLTNGRSAFVYHPETVSPMTHPLASHGNPATAGKSDDTDLTVENRLNVSRDFLRPMDLTAGKLVKVSTTNGVMSIEATTLTVGDTLVVNADGRLRLGENMLTRAFGQLNKKYNIELSSDKSVIKVQPITT
jgi:hypothetical protein